MGNSFLFKLAKLILINLLLIVLAGAIVRATQSGMGCPDWPKCFGYWIPPTQIEQIQFKPKTLYNKKQFIIHNDSLFYAKQKFMSDEVFNNINWVKYEKHDYAVFKTHHTWIEYINRLVTVLLGILLLLQLFVAIKNRYLKTNTIQVFLMLAMLLVTGFQAWLGKIVVDTNLAVGKITLHMLGMFVLLALQLIIIHRERPVNYTFNSSLKWIVILATISLIIQILLGTQVREQIDVIAKNLNYSGRDLWIAQLDNKFLIHRSFSWLVTIFCILIFIFSKNNKNLITEKKYIMVALASLILLGIIMAYYNIPFWSQPLHLLSSSILFVGFFKIWLKTKFNR